MDGSLKQVCGFQTWTFIARFLHFVFYIFEISDQGCLGSIVNPTYLIGFCDCTVINLALKTIVLIFNITHKMGCCERWYLFG